MIQLRKIGENNFRDIMSLHVRDDQKSFVAPNDLSLIEAFIAISHNGKAFPFGIYDGDIPVGFCMIGFGADEDWEDAPAVAKDNYNLWRLMIDKKYQGQGLGRQTMDAAMDLIRTFPFGEAKKVWLSYEPENTHAREIYRKYGFTENGEMCGNEIIAVYEL